MRRSWPWAKSSNTLSAKLGRGSGLLQQVVLKLRSRRVVLAAIFVFIGIVLPVTLNATTPFPAVLVLRPIFNGALVTLGPYQGDLARVTSRMGVPIKVSNAPGASVDIYTPIASAEVRPLVLWIHGGGFVAGSAAQVRDYAKVLAARGFTVASLEYSLAPEERYPTPILQANAALAYLTTHAANYGTDPTRVFIAGDSAGAQIASQMGAFLTNPSLSAEMGITPAIAAADLRGVILNCGLYDLDTVGNTGFPAIRTFLWAYTGVRDYQHFAKVDQLSTVRQITAQYPATYLTVGDADPFESQAYELDAVLRAHGVTVTSRYWTGSGRNLGHEYQFKLDTAPGRQVLSDIVTFIEQKAK